MTVKFFIGTDVNGGCAECQMVLAYSIQKHCSEPYEIVWMKISDDPTSFWHGWNTSIWSTPFSGFRWGIPEYCNFSGRAIYCDDDQMFLTDPVELWNAQFEPGKICQAKWHTETAEIRFCVMLWDCAAAQRVMLPIERNKKLAEFHPRMTYMIANSNKVQFFDRNWNNFDGENEKLENIKLLHFTDMSTNPGVHLAVKRLGDRSEHWYNGPLRTHRRTDVVEQFQKYYNEALDAGFNVEDYLPENRIFYTKQDQSQYRCNNGYDVTMGQ